MTIAPGTLETLHRIHCQLNDVSGRIAAGPRQIKAAEQAVAKAEQELVAAKDAYKKTRMVSDEKQLHLKQREAKLRDLQGKLNAAESNREYQLLKDQIAADQKANSVLTDEILESLELLDQRQADIKTADGNLAKMKEELVRVKQRVENLRPMLDGELTRVRGDLAVTEQKLPPEFKVDYDRVVKAKGEDALGPVEGDSCGQCSRILTPQMLNELHLRRPVFCKACGSLLYVPSDE